MEEKRQAGEGEGEKGKGRGGKSKIKAKARCITFKPSIHQTLFPSFVHCFPSHFPPSFPFPIFSPLSLISLLPSIFYFPRRAFLSPNNPPSLPNTFKKSHTTLDPISPSNGIPKLHTHTQHTSGLHLLRDQPLLLLVQPLQGGG